jgi:L-ornithine Nalpha-acyltransferase
MKDVEFMSQLVELTSIPAAEWVVKVAECEDEVFQAMRLRYEVFVEEENNMQLKNDFRLERDLYDAYCDHLIVQDKQTSAVIGTYRLLPGKRAVEGIGFYSQSEFDLSGMAPFQSRTLELGRSCVAPAYRNGRAIQLLWGGIARYLEANAYDYLIGCASMHMNDLRQLNEIYTLLCLKSVITNRYGITPLASHRIEGLELLQELPDEKDILRRLPPLMKGYQWLGAEIGGEPAYDPLFNTVDFLIVLDRHKVMKRYKQHFLREPKNA